MSVFVIDMLEKVDIQNCHAEVHMMFDILLGSMERCCVMARLFQREVKASVDAICSSFLLYCRILASEAMNFW